MIVVRVNKGGSYIVAEMTGLQQYGNRNVQGLEWYLIMPDEKYLYLRE